MSWPSLEEMSISHGNTFKASFDSFNKSTECYFDWLQEKFAEAKSIMAEDVEFATAKTPGKRKKVARRPLVVPINENAILSSEDNFSVQPNMDDEGVLKATKWNLRSTQQSTRRMARKSRPVNGNDLVDYHEESESDEVYVSKSQTNKSRLAKRKNSKAVSRKINRTTRASARHSKLQRTLDSSSDVANDEDPAKPQSPKPGAEKCDVLDPVQFKSEGTVKHNHHDAFVPNKNLNNTYLVPKPHTPCSKQSQPSFSVNNTTVVIAGSSVPSHIMPEKTFLVNPGRAINNETFVKPRITEEGCDVNLLENINVSVGINTCSDSNVMLEKLQRLQVNISPEKHNVVSITASASVPTPSNGNKTFTFSDRDAPFTNLTVVPLGNDDFVVPSPIEGQKQFHSKKELAYSQSHSSLSKKKDAVVRRLLQSQKADTPFDWSKKKQMWSTMASKHQTKFVTKSASLSRLNNISAATTFLNPSTLVKQPTAEEIEAKKLEEFIIRQKKAEEALRKKEELDKKKRELAKKNREMRLERVNRNKKEKEAESLKLKLQLENAQQNLTEKEREREERLKEDQAKRQMKNRLKLEEAEARRKLDEEARQSKLRQQEFIQKENENKLNRRRELEEQERKKRLAESRLLQEERAANAEKEKARLLQQQRRELKQKNELEKLKGKEKEKLMREKQEKLLEEKHKQQEAQAKEKEAIGDSNTYEITPIRVTKISSEIKNANPENYGIDDLKSDDDTDDDAQPKKRIPEWASGCKLKAALIQQEYMQPHAEKLFGFMIAPDLARIFTRHRKRFFKRTSSAIWNSPVPL